VVIKHDIRKKSVQFCEILSRLNSNIAWHSMMYDMSLSYTVNKYPIGYLSPSHALMISLYFFTVVLRCHVYIL
jgi:hypothetical protein